MARTVDFSCPSQGGFLEAAGKAFRASLKPVALTGAGISVDSGIPDFRSPGGLWEKYPAEEYAGIDTFIEDPAKSWVLFREMGRTVAGARPNSAHAALADLEARAGLAGVITQNVDGLHQAAGSKSVVEMHGEMRSLRCIRCNRSEPANPEILESESTPQCRSCGTALKPDVVLFGEPIKGALEIQELVDGCDLLLVVGTSASVYPAAAIPLMVRGNGGAVYEFNTDQTRLTADSANEDDFFFKGRAAETLPAFCEAALQST